MNNLNFLRILIAAERMELRCNLRASLQSDAAFCVVAEAATVRDAARLVGEYQPQILLVDFELKPQSELSELLLRSPFLQVVAVVREMRAQEVIDAVRLGAHGIVREAASRDVYQETVRNVAAGRYCYESDAMAIVVESLRQSVASPSETERSGDFALTPRELQIISKIKTGCSNRMVSEEFAISERTVKHHLTNIYSKIGVTNRLSLALFALDHRLMSKP